MQRIGKFKKVKLLFFSMFIPILSFSSEYVLKTTQMFSSNGKLMGTVYKGTQINKSATGFNITAWVMDGNEYILFYSKDEKIKLARIDESFVKQQVLLGTTKDVYDVQWKKVQLSFNVKVKNFTLQENKKLWSNETELYQRCGSCHSLHPYNEFTPNQWPSIIKTMQNNAGFSKQEAKNVSIFLQYKSLKGK